MQLVAPLEAVAVVSIGVVVAPWVTLGIAVLYIKLVRNGTTLRWFDLPPLAVVLVSAYVVTIQVVAFAAAVQLLTGRKIEAVIGPQDSPRSGRVA